MTAAIFLHIPAVTPNGKHRGNLKTITISHLRDCTTLIKIVAISATLHPIDHVTDRQRGDETMTVYLINNDPFGNNVKVIDKNAGDALLFNGYIDAHTTQAINCRE